MAVVAVGVHRVGQREVLRFDVGPAESHAFWLAFLRGLAKRGLRGTKLVVSDAHEGLKQGDRWGAGGTELATLSVHFMRNLLVARTPTSAIGGGRLAEDNLCVTGSTIGARETGEGRRCPGG